MSSDPKQPKSPEASEDDAFSSTLPSGTQVPDFLKEKAAEIRAKTPKSTEIEEEDGLLTSANASRATTAGSMSLAGSRLSENEARQILEKRFAEAGYRVETDYPFVEGDTSVNLDGFDPKARIGYQYVSHEDADVVTDLDKNTERALREMCADGQTRILVVHNVASSDDLVSRIDAFLAVTT